MIRLPLPPPINQTYKTGQGRFYKSKEAKEWEEEAGWLIKKAWRKKPLKEKVYVGIAWFLKRDRDIDSGIKILLDTLQRQSVYENDKQVCHINVHKYPVKEDPGVEIEVRPML